MKKVKSLSVVWAEASLFCVAVLFEGERWYFEGEKVGGKFYTY